MYAQDSIELLLKSGIDFKQHEEFGIDIYEFGELFITSGMALLNDVKWISFHRYNNYHKSILNYFSVVTILVIF